MKESKGPRGGLGLPPPPPSERGYQTPPPVVPYNPGGSGPRRRPQRPTAETAAVSFEDAAAAAHTRRQRERRLVTGHPPRVVVRGEGTHVVRNTPLWWGLGGACFIPTPPEAESTRGRMEGLSPEVLNQRTVSFIVRFMMGFCFNSKHQRCLSPTQADWGQHRPTHIFQPYHWYLIGGSPGSPLCGGRDPDSARGGAHAPASAFCWLPETNFPVFNSPVQAVKSRSSPQSEWFWWAMLLSAICM